MKELTTQQECIDFIGKETILKFNFGSEGVLHYKTITPLEINGDYFKAELTVFLEDNADFFCYEPLGDLMFKKQIFELRLKDGYSNYETVFQEMYKGQ